MHDQTAASSVRVPGSLLSDLVRFFPHPVAYEILSSIKRISSLEISLFSKL